MLCLDTPMRHLFGSIPALFLLAGLSATTAMADDKHGCRAGLDDESIAGCRRMVAAGTAGPRDLAAALRERGRDYTARGELDRATAELDEAIRADPTYAAAYISRGIAHRRKGNVDDAIFDFSQAARRDPAATAAFHNRALAYQAKGELDRAIADFDQVIVLNPDDAGAYNNRGRVHESRRDLDRALADYD
jgi:tetratricopeptide (TPR) repeat protein